MLITISDLEQRAAQGWYQARRLPAMIAIPYPAGRPDAVALDRLLAERGWTVRSGAATVMTARGDQARAGPGPVPPVAVEMPAVPDEAWLAGARGAGHLYLQVEDGNAAARALYRGIGFTDHHGYHYRVAPEAGIV